MHCLQRHFEIDLIQYKYIIQSSGLQLRSIFLPSIFKWLKAHQIRTLCLFSKKRCVEITKHKLTRFYIGINCFHSNRNRRATLHRKLYKTSKCLKLLSEIPLVRRREISIHDSFRWKWNWIRQTQRWLFISRTCARFTPVNGAMLRCGLMGII